MAKGKPPYPAIARGNAKNPVISIRRNAIDPEGVLLHQLKQHFGDKIDWHAVALAAIEMAERRAAVEADDNGF